MKGNPNIGNQICTLTRSLCLWCSERIRRSKNRSKEMIWEVAAVMQAQVHEADHSHTVVAESPAARNRANFGVFTQARHLFVVKCPAPEGSWCLAAAGLRFLYTASAQLRLNLDARGSCPAAASLSPVTPDTFSGSPSSLSLNRQRSCLG